MSLTQAQIQFAAEFVTLMVSAAALALIALRRPERGDDGVQTWLGRIEGVESPFKVRGRENSNGNGEIGKIG